LTLRVLALQYATIKLADLRFIDSNTSIKTDTRRISLESEVLELGRDAFTITPDIAVGLIGRVMRQNALRLLALRNNNTGNIGQQLYNLSNLISPSQYTIENSRKRIELACQIDEALNNIKIFDGQSFN